MTMEPTSELSVRDLCVAYGRGIGRTTVVHDVSFELGTGRTHGLVGESGSGKSTIANAIVGFVSPASGSIRLRGEDFPSPHLSRRQRRLVQVVPQDPYSSLNPRRTVGQAMAEAVDPAAARVRTHRGKIEEALDRVGIPADAMDRYPHQFSGGQRQRIVIARALVVEPAVVIADEATSALDVSIQAQVLRLLAKLGTELSLTILFIAHNLAVVRQVCDDVTVLYQGRVVESGSSDDVFLRAQNPYTRTLLSSVPGSEGFTL